MIDIRYDTILKNSAPDYAGVMLECKVVNSSLNLDLWKEINAELNNLRASYKLEEVNKRPGIFEMRHLYKILGKDPNRYRPSAEALCRRILQGKDLYRINTLVDLINLISLQTGLSIGGFDASKIVGNIVFGVGRANEPFEAIGRGLLNIDGLPVYRDDLGGIGTPTSDVERTKLTLDTTHLLMVIHSAEGEGGLANAEVSAKRLLENYASATEIFSQKF